MLLSTTTLTPAPAPGARGDHQCRQITPIRIGGLTHSPRNQSKTGSVRRRSRARRDTKMMQTAELTTQLPTHGRPIKFTPERVQQIRNLIGRTENSQAADGDPLAPCWVPSLLALEITRARRPAKDTGGHSPAPSRYERREPALGSATDPRRTAQAWHRCRADHRGKIHGEEKAATVAGLENLSAQSCRRHCVDGFVRSPYDLVSAVVWISDLAAFPPQASVVGRDRTPERPLDCPSTDRSLRLATDATIYRSRSRLRLWQGCHSTASSNGYTGSADLATIALAKRILGEAHRLDPTGLS